ncbi:MAG: HAD hydrolase-like protein [Nanoarchaeota archaeon]|nr:HAD hydrolase-like protein [Nanoarchaeota archaeon]
MAKKKLYGLIFDSDGTILDSKPNQFEWLKHCVIDLYNKEFQYKKCSGEFLNDYNKAHRVNGLVGVYEMLGINYEKDKDLLWEHFNTWRRGNPPPIIKGMKETILEIYRRSRPKPGKSCGLRFLLNTSNRWPSFEKQLDESGLIKCFDTILTRDDIPEAIDAEGNSKPLVKPNTYSIELALDLLGISPEEALHVGDTLEDITSCRSLKRKDPDVEKEVKVVSVTWGFETKENLASAKPYKIINNPKQLIKIVEQLGGFD